MSRQYIRSLGGGIKFVNKIILFYTKITVASICRSEVLCAEGVRKLSYLFDRKRKYGVSVARWRERADPFHGLCLSRSCLSLLPGVQGLATLRADTDAGRVPGSAIRAGSPGRVHWGRGAGLLVRTASKNTVSKKHLRRWVFLLS